MHRGIIGNELAVVAARVAYDSTSTAALPLAASSLYLLPRGERKRKKKRESVFMGAPKSFLHNSKMLGSCHFFRPPLKSSPTPYGSFLSPAIMGYAYKKFRRKIGSLTTLLCLSNQMSQCQPPVLLPAAPFTALYANILNRCCEAQGWLLLAAQKYWSPNLPSIYQRRQGLCYSSFRER